MNVTEEEVESDHSQDTVIEKLPTQKPKDKHSDSINVSID